jgi:cobalt-precorrin-5B (C1)-methyltransferase
MILLFGGTTEGRAVSQLLDFLEEPYLYLTRSATSQKVKGAHRYGALNELQMVHLCREQKARLIIDAGHPYALQLHQTVVQAAKCCGVPALRLERPAPASSAENECWFDNYEAVVQALQQKGPVTVLALTGVQTIPRFNKLPAHCTMHFRILDTPLSWAKAMETGIDPTFIHPAPAHITMENLEQLMAKTHPDILLTKESGSTGYFHLKQQMAAKHDLPLWIVARPELPTYDYEVRTMQDLHTTLLEIRKTLWKDAHQLRSGWTTGTCATAAAKGAFLKLLTGKTPPWAEVVLPSGKLARLALYPEQSSATEAACTVVKDAGDDPDITHAAVIGCKVRLTKEPGIQFRRGTGVGLVTLPGLSIAPGEPAINATPRKMMRELLKELADNFDYSGGLIVTPFVPDGEKLALRTFNSRVGVSGGISIIGTSGEVRPLSDAAFIHAIAQQIKVARASGINELVSTAGLRGENHIRPYFSHLPPSAFIHHGNFVGETVRTAHAQGMCKITIGIMPGKAIKLAEGHLDTHSRHGQFSSAFLLKIARESGLNDNALTTITQIQLLNELKDKLTTNELMQLYQVISKHCWEHLIKLTNDRMKIEVFIIR